MSPARPIRVVVIIAAAFAGLFMIGTATEESEAPAARPDSRGEAGTTVPVGAATAPTMADGLPTSVGYVVSRPGAMLDSLAEVVADGPVAGGVLLPVLEDGGDRFRVMTTCNTEAWISSDHVRAGAVPVGGESFGQSVFVIDAGHGLPDLGATGPAGLTESEVNLDVAARLVDLLSVGHDIDWASGEVTAGSSVPPAAIAVMTRPIDGPNGGEYELGLTFRATVANALDATALISIHHNSGPEVALDHPGSEAYVPVDDPDSARLAGLMVDELRSSFARFSADWMGAPGSGLITRIDEDGTDYYTVLEQAESPAVIVEGAYISNPSEEALAMTDEFRQEYAEATYRALVRFVTTADDPLPVPEPVVWNVDTGTVSMEGCDIPRP